MYFPSLHSCQLFIYIYDQCYDYTQTILKHQTFQNNRFFIIQFNNIQIYLAMGNQNKKQGGLFQKSQKGGYQELKDGVQKCCKCSWKTRILGYIICFALGWLLSIFITVVFIIKHDTVQFAVLYSIGQIINISGSCFLATPITQVKDMFKKTRWVLTLLYLGSIAGTIVMAILLPDHLKGLVILMLVIQIIAYYLYTLSYIPFGRKIIKKCCECILL